MKALRCGACPHIHTLEMLLDSRELEIFNGECRESEDAGWDEAKTELNMVAVADALEERQRLGTCASLKCFGRAWLLYSSPEVQIRLLKLLLPTLEELPDGGIDFEHHGGGFMGVEVPFLEVPFLKELEISAAVIPVIEALGTMVTLEALSFSAHCLDGGAVDAFISALHIHKRNLLPKLKVLGFHFAFKVGEGIQSNFFKTWGKRRRSLRTCAC